MNEKRMKDALESIARRGVPENTNLMPRIAAQLERKSPMTTLRTRPFAAILIAIFILLTLSGVAYALSRALGYIPGVGIVDQSSPLRVLAEPVSQTRDGIIVTVKEAVLSSDKTIVVIAFENVPVDKVPNQEDMPDCAANADLRLPEGEPLHVTGGQGNEWGAGSEYHFTYTPIPSDVNEATLLIGCIPGDVSPRVLPENWELPLRFVPAPADMTALPVVEYVTSPAPTDKAEANRLTITKVIDTGNSYILVGSFALQANPNGYFPMNMRTLIDGNGNMLPWKMPQTAVLPEHAPDEPFTGTEDWAVEVDKGFVPPLTVKFSINDSYPTTNDAPLEYEFDAGENPKVGDKWQVNQEIQAGDYSFTLVSIHADTDASIPDAYGYRFTFKPLKDSVSNLNLEIEDQEFTAGITQSGKLDSFDYFIGYPELPKGKLKVLFSLDLKTTQDWTLQWTPAGASNIVTPTEVPQACLTTDSWQAALATTPRRFPQT